MDPPIPAATLVLMRQIPHAAPELLMIERAARMAFAAGALVFPGGRVDPEDWEIAADRRLAAAAGLEEADSAARVAAIRETIEEAGIGIGLDPNPPAEMLAVLRSRLAAGERFARLLEEAGVRLDLGRLVAFSRWRPGHREIRTFDTRFYLAACPAEVEVSVDGGETVHALWAPAAEVLALADSGERQIIFPTRRNLERLAGFSDFRAACADAAAHSLETITPWIEERDGEQWLCIPDDRGYPVTAELLESARRG